MQLGLRQATPFLRLGDLPARQANMRTDDNEPVAARTTGRPDLCRGERALRFEPSQCTGERRAAAVYKRFAPLLRLERAEDDDLQVGVVGGVDHHPCPVVDRAEDFGDPLGSALPDVGQGDGVDLVHGDRAVALLGDEFPQVGRGVAEGGVPGELAGADRNGFSGHISPVDVTGGEPAGFEVGGHQQPPVEPFANDPAPGGVDGTHLGEDMAPQGGIAAADHLDGCAQGLPQGEQAGGNTGREFDRGILGQAAGVGQHKAGRTGFGKARGVFGILEHGDHRDVVHRLRARGVVVEGGDPPTSRDVGCPDPAPGAGFFADRRRCGEHLGGNRYWRCGCLVCVAGHGSSVDR
jgi:hypothetical protein